MQLREKVDLRSSAITLLALRGRRGQGCRLERRATLVAEARAVARTLAARVPDADITAITIVPRQIWLGRAQNDAAGLAARIHMLEADYTSTGLAPCSYDAAYAVESMCHAEGRGKPRFLAEAARLLRPGAPFVITDGFVREPLATGTMERIYRGWCEGWAIPEMPHLQEVLDQLAVHGFAIEQVEDVSWRVAPSAAHVLWVASWFALRALAKGRGRMPAWRWRHIRASFLTLLLGLTRRHFGYYVITARRLST